MKAWLHLMTGHVEAARGVLQEGIRQVGIDALLFNVSQSSSHIRMHRIFSGEYGPALERIGWDVFGLDSVDFYFTKAIAYRTDTTKARVYYDSLGAWAESRIRRGGTSSAAYHVLWVMGLAGSGKHDVAMREINRLVSDARRPMYPMEHEEVAEACVLAREYECAMTQIRAALIDPYVLTPELLRLDPFWDPLRGRADFQKLAGTVAQ